MSGRQNKPFRQTSEWVQLRKKKRWQHQIIENNTKSFSMCFSIAVNSILDAGGSLVWFTTLNLKSGYWQVEVDPEG